MDQPSTADRAPAYTDDQQTHPGAAAESTHRRDRRREKPQLSCNLCRRRKIRCDRQLPCKTCVSKGIALSCTYTPGPHREGTVSVRDRIQQLEDLVRSLERQQHQQSPQTPAVPSAGPLTDSSAHSLGGTPGESPQGVSVGSGRIPTRASADQDTEHPAVSPLTHASLPSSKDNVTSPASSEHGSLRMHLHGANYVSNVHWAAVLDSISELKDHYEQEEEDRMLPTSDDLPRYGPSPRLLYEPVQATKADILASIPARPAVDRMVARYFNVQGITPAILHGGQFLREYENFWQDPAVASFAWIGLLFSIMCLSTQCQQWMAEVPTDPGILMRIHTFHERTVHCLVLGEFTRGGAHVLETVINHLASEVLLSKEADIGVWLLLGLLVQLALSLGYHRDPQNFPSISPFVSEMRRRVWGAIVQMDLRLSSQMGLPRILKSQECDTAEPRNLLDSDFDEATVKLPPSRPDTEVTPVLYGLAKNRIDSIGGLISDLVADLRDHTYPEIMELDRKLREAEASLPPIFRWQPLSQSLTVPSQIILYRLWLHLAVQRLVICLHRKYLAPSRAHVRYDYSRNACVQAAIRILELQQMINDETQPDGQLHPMRWMPFSLMQSVFLLGMSVLCYYVQLAKTMPGVMLNQDTGVRIHDLLRNTYPMWLRSSNVSRVARKAVEHLSRLLGLQGQQQDAPLAQEATAHQFTTPKDGAVSVDQIIWDAYQECMANFPSTFSPDCIGMGPPGPSSAMDVSMTDPLFVNRTELGGWMASENILSREG